MKKSKKLLSAILSVAVATTMFSGVTAFAADENITVELDGNAILFDVEPEIIDGRTMVPLRKIFEEIGALVKWDNDTQTVSARKSSKTITLTINSADMQIDKGKTDEDGNAVIETVTLDVPAQIVSDRTLVPARAISEAFGLDVEWNQDTKTVSITSSSEDDDSWKENVGSINLTELTFEGDGIEIADNQIAITKGGDYTISGTLDDGNITVKTEERVKLRLAGASITSSENPCIYFEEADKAYITITEGTKNYLTAYDAKGALYSKENLEIKGGGELTINADSDHGIKAADNLTIENGTINIEAAGDGIHINDTFKMSGGSLNIVSAGDGIDSESIVIVSGGEINIETTGEPLETTTAATTDTATENGFAMPGGGHRGMAGGMQEAASVEFAASTKGINAEWMLSISGGNITVNSSDHAIHCADEIEITGSSLILSSKYAKGISGHGNVTIDGSETLIDIIKSTEGLESKNVLTVNDGTIKIVASDDGINATGGNSGDMMGMGQNGGMNNAPIPGNNQGTATDENTSAMPDAAEVPQGLLPGGMNRKSRNTMSGSEQTANQEIAFRIEMFPGEEMIPDAAMTQPGNAPQLGAFPSDNAGNRGGMGMGGRNQKECLIINGGIIEIYAGDDCLDANGNMTLNGGTIKAVKTNGTFTGTDSIFDPDGQLVISEGVTIIAACRGSQGNISIPQNTLTLYCESAHSSGDKIILYDAHGNELLEYSPQGGYNAVLITSPHIELGESYTLTAGASSYEVTVSESNTVIGTQTSTGGNRNKMVQ